MDIEKFNNKVLNDRRFNFPNDLKVKLENGDEALYEICREVYLTAYHSSVEKNGEQVRLFISANNIQILSGKVKQITEMLLSSVNVEHYKLLLSIIEKYYIKTATSDERQNRSFTIKNEKNSMISKLYFTDVIPDWNDFSENLIKEAYK